MKINFENILADFNSFFLTFKKVKNPILVSFTFSIEDSIEILQINMLGKFYNDIFLFQTVSEQLKIIGLNSTIEFQEDNSKTFSDISKNYDYWRKNFVNNWSEANTTTAKMLFCSAKFDPINSSELWNDFGPIRIYVPELILTYNGKRLTCLFNFILNEKDQIESISRRLLKYLKTLGVLETDNSLSVNTNRSIQSDINVDDFTSWNEAALKTLTNLKSGEIDKLVLSRSYSFTINKMINWDAILQELYNRFPDCYLFFIKKRNSVFFGSSPELFLKVKNGSAEVESVAGSAARGKKRESDHELEKFLKSSDKNHQEHLFVSNFITDILIKYSNNVRVIEEKQIRKLDNIQHLITKISAELNSEEILFELIDDLFPTPAVCGVPKENVIELIRKMEIHDRGLYSGLIGVFDFNSNCELAVSIRSALVRDNQITAFAGAGLVKDSDPKEEFHETNLKLNTILSLFTDENKS